MTGGQYGYQYEFGGANGGSSYESSMQGAQMSGGQYGYQYGSGSSLGGQSSAYNYGSASS